MTNLVKIRTVYPEDTDRNFLRNKIVSETEIKKKKNPKNYGYL